MIEAMDASTGTTPASTAASATLSEEATDLYEGRARKVAGLLGSTSPREVVFTRNVTSASTSSPSPRRGQPPGGRRIPLTEMEHRANIVPWHMIAQRTGAELQFAPDR